MPMPPLTRTLLWGLLWGFLALLLCPTQAQAWRWKHWRLNLKIDLASGYDDNVRRIALPPQPEFVYTWTDLTNQAPVASPLPPVSIHSDGMHQAALDLKLQYRSRRHVLRTNYAIAFKHFFFTPDEDALSQRGQVSYFFRAHRRVILGVNLSAGDLRRWNQSRETSHLRGHFQALFLIPHGFQIDVTGGYGLYLYRHFEEHKDINPEGISDGERFSSHGDAYGITVRKRFSRVFRAHLAYQFSRQFYQILRTRTAANVCSISRRSLRTDTQHHARAGIRVLYHVLFDASYQFDTNNAESCGESFIGHRLLFRIAARPFWRLYITTELQLQFRTFVDGAPFDPSFRNNQDDTLTTFTIRVSRPLLPHLRVNLRYSHFANLLGLGINQYARNLFTVGLTLQF